MEKEGIARNAMGVLSVKDEEKLLLTPEEQQAIDSKRNPQQAKTEQPAQEPVKEDVPTEQTKAAEPKTETTEAAQARVESEAKAGKTKFTQEDYNRLLEVAEKKGYTSVEALIKSYDEGVSWGTKVSQKNKKLQEKIDELEERLTKVSQPVQQQPIDPEKMKEMFYKSYEEDPIGTIQAINRYQLQAEVMPQIQQIYLEKEREISKLAVNQASKNLKLWGQVKERVQEILEDDPKFSAMRGQAKTLDDKYEVLQMAYQKALAIDGLEEQNHTSRVVVQGTSVAPKVETPDASGVNNRQPAPKKSAEENIADAIVAAAYNDPIRKFFRGGGK